MKVTRAGVDRSTNYSPDEFDTISVVLVGWDGEVGQGTVPIPDPSGNQEPYEGEQLLLEQDSLTILDGFLGSITTDRGGSSAGARRVHTVTLADDNALLSGHATASWSRPAEAPAARWAAFVAAFLPGSVTTTWLLTTNESGITLPAKIYRSDSLFDDISADTIGPTGKTVYLEHRNFHWHLPTEGQTCSLSIHDTTFNQSTSFFPDPKAQRSKDGMDLRTKIYARNDAGVVVSVQDATAITRHEAAGLKHQGYSEYGSETSSEMTRDINVTLAERKAERTTWTYTIGPLTAAQVVELIPGSQITVTVALHDLSAAVKRIARVSLAYKHGRDSRHFMATLELGYPRRVKRKPTRASSPADSSGGSGVAGSGGGPGGHSDCGCPPWADSCTPLRETFTRTVGAGSWGISELGGTVWNPYYNGAAASVNGTDGVLAPTGSIGSSAIEEIGLPVAFPIHLRTKQKILAPDDGILQFYFGPALPYTGAPGNVLISLQETVGGSPNSLAMAAEIVGSGGVAAIGSTTYPFGLIDPINQWFWLELLIEARTLSVRAWLDGNSPGAYIVYTLAVLSGDLVLPTTLAVTAITSEIGTTTADWRVTLIELLCETPDSGREINGEFLGIGDGVRSAFTFQYPYQPRSAHVEVDNIHHPVTETDPTTGDVDLGFAPIAGEKVTGDYRAA